MRMIVAAVLVTVLALLAAPASAMTFKFGTLKGGVPVVVATGDIVKGDARRLIKALERAARGGSGTIQVYLESRGGLVLEALKMADVLAKSGVTTVVRKGAVCASACASILFVAGRFRTIESGGILAIHSCHDAVSGRAVSACNAVISSYAEASGVSGATMMALQEAAGDDAVIVFDEKDAACFGLTLKPGARPSKKVAPCVADALKGR
jgi:hypothetical protein